MQFGNRPRGPGRPNPKSPPPLSVGHRAFVNRVPTQGLGAVPLTDERDRRTLRTLSDGQEVEILAWRQRPHVRYHVRCVSRGVEGWLDAECLRATRTPLPEAAPVGSVPRPRAANVGDRRMRSRAPASGAPLPVGQPRTPPTAVASARDAAPVPCPVCGEEVHPYNLWRNAKDVVVGCYLCRGRRP
jgi:hypothetical protein